MTDNATLSWLELPAIELPAEPPALTSAFCESGGDLVQALLWKSDGADWRLRVQKLTESGWETRFEEPIALAGPATGTAPTLFMHQFEADGVSHVRIDAIGAGLMAAWIGRDGSDFERLESPGPLLDEATVLLGESGMLAFATTLEHPLPQLWQTSSLRGNEWQHSEHQPPVETVSHGVCALHFFEGQIAAAFRHPHRGFSLWQGPEEWKALIESGAWKFAMNGEVFAMREFQGALYLATGVTDAEQARISPFHQQGFELLRVYPNGDWDLLVGQPVFTPIGLRHPLSTLGAGFDDVSNDRVLALETHSDRLFLLGRSLDGLRLWESGDGIDWAPVEMPDAPALHAAPRVWLISTPAGLCVTEGQTVFRLVA